MQTLGIWGMPADAFAPHVVLEQSWVPQNRPKPSWPGYGKNEWQGNILSCVPWTANLTVPPLVIHGPKKGTKPFLFLK